MTIAPNRCKRCRTPAREARYGTLDCGERRGCEGLREHAQAQRLPCIPRITALHANSIEPERAEWTGARGWFDELAKVSKRRATEDTWPWTGTPEAAIQAELGEGAVKLSDSYFAFDIADWDDIQDERDRSLTLPHAEEELLDAQIQRIREVIDD
ncbi:hypothetical protein A0H81_06419 [Grifola frondosa]|uniref:Uncharacterized protein n=1 Tax=Grifola frondosa TaxID=5627 RepID=A0A1C7MAJ2_GRIFR|nr:hypothetical protein A0H81_06419 [Grifola frondosa]